MSTSGGVSTGFNGASIPVKKRQVLNDEQDSTNRVLSFFQQRRIKLRQLMHQRHLARKKRRAERAKLNERLLQESLSE